MFHTFKTLASDAVMQRLVLLANHVLAGERAATDRMRPYAGRHLRLSLNNWPSLLPAVPPLGFDITPAGLIEWRGVEGEVQPAPDLHIVVDASNPALTVLQGLAGIKPGIDITGDAQLAADVSWLIDNLRWDIEDDLARLVGHTPARELARFGAVVAKGLRDIASRVASVASRG